ncbi:UDP-N-acetylglucosamine--N-acetylmuramyl- (pentapeptide) pyrophosphoryl-undecaprenol N-acetylglucosamine transferase [Lactococcus sp. DD01]|nr:UDP-N-acetylglucosamine--N-acetylmuramyl- (pentapeptide) pyrophosphoryl-undecaprenol N-acetylglucosamine transferase [Lactococcus sp. DD01]
MIKDVNLTADTMLASISEIFSDEELYQAMSVASEKAGVPDASDRLYQLVKEIKK